MPKRWEKCRERLVVKRKLFLQKKQHGSLRENDSWTLRGTGEREKLL